MPLYNIYRKPPTGCFLRYRQSYSTSGNSKIASTPLTISSLKKAIISVHKISYLEKFSNFAIKIHIPALALVSSFLCSLEIADRPILCSLDLPILQNKTVFVVQNCKIRRFACDFSANFDVLFANVIYSYLTMFERLLHPQFSHFHTSV